MRAAPSPCRKPPRICPFDDHRVELCAYVVHGGIAYNFELSCLGFDFNRRQIGNEAVSDGRGNPVLAIGRPQHFGRAHDGLADTRGNICGKPRRIPMAAGGEFAD